MDTATPPPPPVPAPRATTGSDLRTWEMLAHLSALAGFIVPLGAFLGPFIVWQIKKNEYPSVEAHAKSSLNFQISCLIYCLICIPLFFVVVGLPLLIAVGIFSLVCVIIATIKTNNGEAWKYPLCFTFLK